MKALRHVQETDLSPNDRKGTVRKGPGSAENLPQRKTCLERKRKKSFGVRFEYVNGRNCGAEKVSGELPARDNHATGPR